MVSLVKFRGDLLYVDLVIQRFGNDKGVLTVGGFRVALTLVGIDKAFPLVVRICGLVTTLVLIGFSLAGFYVQAAPGFVAAAGMILYKNVKDAAEEKQGGDDEDDKRLVDW